VTGNASLERQQAAEEILVHVPPTPDLHEILSPGQRAAENEQKHLRQGKQHLPGLARVLHRAEMLDQQ